MKRLDRLTFLSGQDRELLLSITIDSIHMKEDLIKFFQENYTHNKQWMTAWSKEAHDLKIKELKKGIQKCLRLQKRLVDILYAGEGNG